MILRHFRTRVKSFGALYLWTPSLDQPNEWWYNKDSNTLYYLPPNNVNPNKLKINKNFAVDLLKCQNITFEGLHFCYRFQYSAITSY